jgi:DNA-binding NarL/FixJ family response regulator
VEPAQSHRVLDIARAAAGANLTSNIVTTKSEPQRVLRNARAVRILLADDHEVVRRGLRELLERQTHWKICGEATTGPEAVDMAAALHPDIVILDVNMPGIGSVEATKLIRASLPDSEVLIFTMHEGEEMMRELIGAGARGYLLKSDPASHIVAAVEALANHKPFFTGTVSETLRSAFLKSMSEGSSKVPPSLLSVREREIIQLIAEGKSNKEVAESLKISVKTVETHRATIMRKLGINSVVQLVHYAVRNQIVSP